MVIKGSFMKSLTKYLGLVVCLVGLSSNVFAAASSSVQLDTAIPPVDGMLTTDQIPPMFLPKTTSNSPNDVAPPPAADASPSENPEPVVPSS
jgi:hypothetical protein